MASAAEVPGGQAKVRGRHGGGGDARCRLGSAFSNLPRPHRFTGELGSTAVDMTLRSENNIHRDVLDDIRPLGDRNTVAASRQQIVAASRAAAVSKVRRKTAAAFALQRGKVLNMRVDEAAAMPLGAANVRC